MTNFSLKNNYFRSLGLTLFLLGMTSILSAQINIHNETECSIYVRVYEGGLQGNPCFICASQGAWILPGDFFNVNSSPCSRDTWLFFRHYVSEEPTFSGPLGSYGTAFNPAHYNSGSNGCGINNDFIADCNGTQLNYTWSYDVNGVPTQVVMHY